jgi:hypothetical protein
MIFLPFIVIIIRKLQSNGPLIELEFYLEVPAHGYQPLSSNEYNLLPLFVQFVNLIVYKLPICTIIITV